MAGYTNSYPQAQQSQYYPTTNQHSNGLNGNGNANGNPKNISHTPSPVQHGLNGNGIANINGYLNGAINGNGNGKVNGIGNANGNGNAVQATPKVQPLLCSGHTRPVTHLQFSNLLEDNTYLLISACKDGNPMLRSWLGDWVGTFLGHKGAVWSSKISLDTSRAVTGSADFTAKIWDTTSGEALHTFAHNHIVRTVALNPQQTPQYLLTGGNEKKIRLFDLGRPDAEPLVLGQKSDGLSSNGTIRSVVWDEGQGGTVGVSAAEDGFVRWWDLRTLTETASLDLGQPITSMELAHGGGTLSVTSGNSVHFLDILRQHPPVSINLPHPATSASLHPYARDRFVVGSTLDPWVRVYDLDTGLEKEVYKGHHGPVLSVSYSPDGEVYASGSEDGTIRLWQTNPGKSYGLWQTQE